MSDKVVVIAPITPAKQFDVTIEDEPVQAPVLNGRRRATRFSASSSSRSADSDFDDDNSLLSEDQSANNRVDFHPSPQHKASTLQTFFNLLTSYLGSGILALPFTFKKSGVCVGVFFMLGIAILSNICIKLLLRCKNRIVELSLRTNPRAGDTMSYGDVAHAVDGTAGRRIVDALIMYTQFGVGIVYIIFIGANLASLFQTLSVQAVSMLVAIPLMIISLSRSMKNLAFFGMMAQLFMFSGLLIILGYAIKIGSQVSESDKMIEWTATPDWIYFFGVGVYTYEGIGLALPIENSMKHRKNYNFLLDLTFIVVTIMFLAFGIGAYLGFGYTTEQQITLNLPQKERLAQLVKIILSLCLLCTFPLMLQPVVDITEIFVYSKTNSVKLGRLARPACVALTVVVAVVVPKFAHLMGLVGALGSSMLAFTIPARLYLKLFEDALSVPWKCFLYAIQAFGIVGGLYAGFISFKGILND